MREKELSRDLKEMSQRHENHESPAGTLGTNIPGSENYKGKGSEAKLAWSVKEISIPLWVEVVIGLVEAEGNCE